MSNRPGRQRSIEKQVVADLRASSSASNILFKLGGLLLIATSFAAAWLVWNIQVFMLAPMTVPDSGVQYTIERDTSLHQIANDLYQRGFLGHPRYFAWVAWWEDKDNKIQAGEYRLAVGISPREFLEAIAAGKVVQHALTIVEGWTFDQIRRAMDAEPYLNHETSGISAAEIMALLGWPGEHPEGRFLPETYHFVKNTSDSELLRRAHRAMDRILAKEWLQRAADLPLKNPDQALTLASLIEKETALATERPLIAGVFIRRLKRGMRLQTDPSVIYGLGEAFDGNLRRRDLAIASAYNTYLHRGLPPTPIAMPGAESIHAALHPKPGKALYFVARGDGGHYFSASLEEHLKAVRRYQLKRPHDE